MTTDRVTFTFFRERQAQPIQVTDLVIPGVKPIPDVRAFPLRLQCGYGPKLRIGGAAVQTRATGTLGDLLAGRPLRFGACTPAALQAGRNRLASTPFDPYRLDTVTVGAKPGEAAAARPPQQVKVLSWGSGTRRLEVDAAASSFLTVNENFNAGWRATVGGTELRAVRLDGWKQGWAVPKGTSGVVELAYTPDRAQRIAVVAGLSLLLVLLLVAVWPGGRGDRRRQEPRALVAGTGWPAWAAIGLAAALGGWIAGVPGLAVTVAVAAVCGWARTRRSAVPRALASPWPVALAMLAGAGCLAAGVRLDLLDNPAAPSGPLGDLAPQLLGLVIVGRLAVELWRPKPPGGSGGRISLSWTAPGQGPPGGTGPGAGSAAAPATPPDSGSGPPLRWSPQPSAADPSRRSPGNRGRSRRTRRR